MDKHQAGRGNEKYLKGKDEILSLTNTNDIKEKKVMMTFSREVRYGRNLSLTLKTNTGVRELVQC